MKPLHKRAVKQNIFYLIHTTEFKKSSLQHAQPIFFFREERDNDVYFNISMYHMDLFEKLTVVQLVKNWSIIAYLRTSPGDHLMITPKSLSSCGVSAGIHTESYRIYARRINIDKTSSVQISKSTHMTPFLRKIGGCCNRVLIGKYMGLR